MEKCSLLLKFKYLFEYPANHLMPGIEYDHSPVHPYINPYNYTSS